MAPRLTDLVIVSSKWPPEYGGPGIYYHRHLTHYASLADRLRLISWTRHTRPEEHKTLSNTEVIVLHRSSSWLGSQLRGVRLALVLHRLLRNTKDSSGVLFAGGEISIGWRAVALTLGLMGIPVIVENVLMGADDGKSLQRARWRGLTALAARRLRSFCPVSSGLLQSVRNAFPQANALLLHYGVDLEANTPPDNDERKLARQAIGANDKAFVAVSFGAVHERKGQLSVIDAWLGWVETRQRYEARLYIVGPPSDAAYVESIRCRLGRANPAAARTVILFGFSKEVNVFLRAADVYVSAACAEGLPISIVEALAHGLPVICRRIEGVTDDFMHGQAVTPIMSWSADAVTAALDALSDVELWRCASHDARTVAEDRFDIEKRLRIIDQLLTDTKS